MPAAQERLEGYRRAIAMAEAPAQREVWARAFHDAMSGFRFLPAGRILAGAGTGRSVTLFNCFVMGTLPDSLAGIFDGLKEAALTMKQGGGIGHDFSTLRPKGAPVRGVGADAVGRRAPQCLSTPHSFGLLLAWRILALLDWRCTQRILLILFVLFFFTTSLLLFFVCICDFILCADFACLTMRYCFLPLLLCLIVSS